MRRIGRVVVRVGAAAFLLSATLGLSCDGLMKDMKNLRKKDDGRQADAAKKPSAGPASQGKNTLPSPGASAVMLPRPPLGKHTSTRTYTLAPGQTVKLPLEKPPMATIGGLGAIAPATSGAKANPGQPSGGNIGALPGAAPAALAGLAGIRSELLRLHNAARAQAGGGALKLNAKLNAAAQKFSAFLSTSDTFSHTADGRLPWDRTKAEGYAHRAAAENIAYTSSGGPDRAFQGWMNSPPHKTNLLSRQYTEVGFGHTDGYWVAVFARPK